MKVSGEEAGARLGAHVLPPPLGFAGAARGPGAWLQLWQTVMFMFFNQNTTYTFPPWMTGTPKGVVVTGPCGVEWEGVRRLPRPLPHASLSSLLLSTSESMCSAR